MSSPRFSLLQQGPRSGFLGWAHQLPGGYKEGIHPLQYCKVISLQLIKINEKKLKKKKKKAYTPSQEGCLWVWGQSCEGRAELQSLPASPSHLSHLSAPPPAPSAFPARTAGPGGW